MQKMNRTRQLAGMAKSYLKKAVLWRQRNPHKAEMLFPSAFMVALVIMTVLL